MRLLAGRFQLSHSLAQPSFTKLTFGSKNELRIRLWVARFQDAIFGNLRAVFGNEAEELEVRFLL